MSDGRQRLSGAEYRKRKAEKEVNLKKQAGSLKKFFLQSTETKSHNVNINETQKTSIGTSGSDSIKKTVDTDPATWPIFLNDTLKTIIVEKGPPLCIDHDFVFPLDDNNRRFTVFNYQRCLSNGEKVPRTWLVYSVSKDVIFCYYCKLFSNSKTKLGTDGSNDWRHVSTILKEHETSNNHLRAHQLWIEFSLRLKTKKTIDDTNQRIFESEKKYWKAILQRIVSIIQLLGQQSLAFRGSSDLLYKHNNGNFLKIIELMALYDPIMSEHVRRTINTKNKTHYLGKDIQNEIINLISGAIKKRILDMLKKAKYYSIILDCTPDLSHTEQMTMIIRFVFVEPSKKEASVTICEHFLGFLSVENSTGMSLSDVILLQLTNMEIPIENMRGQGYDNGANMKGKHSGVQRRIRNINPRAFFVPCSAHSLNLVVNDAVKSSKEAIEFFDIIQKVYVFFSASVNRWKVLLDHITNLTLKPLSQTRWESRIEALKPFRHQIGEIYDALFDIVQDTNGDSMTRHEAECLCRHIKQFKFLCSLIIWYDLLNLINPVSKLMQTINFDISAAMKILETLLSYLKQQRTDNDNSFEKIVLEATKLASEIDVEPIFEYTIGRITARRVKRQFDYENADDPIIDPKVHFKVNFYNNILDIAINSINDRFEQLKEHSDYFLFLYDINKLKNMTYEELLNHCKDLQLFLTDGDSADINGVEMADELRAIIPMVESNLSPIELLKFVISIGSFAPNISIALRILLTLPVTVASGERSFSKLKLIKTYQRTTMTNDRLSGLAMIAIEHQVCQELDVEEIIKDFASAKARKVI